MAITRNDFTRQYDHAAVIAHGAHPEYRVEFDAPLKNETASKSVRQGSIVSLNADGEYILGCPGGTTFNYPVPCVCLKNAADPDVTTGVAGTTYRSSTYSAVGGKITAIPCTAGYEIETTEFDTTATYAPNDALTVKLDSSAQTGLVTKASAQPFKATGSQVIVGFVSKAKYTASNYDHDRLSFFTNFIPVAH